MNKAWYIPLVFNVLIGQAQALVWKPFFTLEAGFAQAVSPGEAKGFPIINPDTDEFYAYHSNKPDKTAGLGGIFLGGEFPINPLWALQAGVEYNKATRFSAGGDFTQGADQQSADNYTYHYNIATSQLLLEGKLLYTLKEIYHPYVLVGLGAAFNRAYNYSTNVSPTLAFTRFYRNASTSEFSYTLGLGMDVNLSSQVRLGAGYRYVGLGRNSLGDSWIDTTPVYGTLAQQHLNANEFVAQITWVLG